MGFFRQEYHDLLQGIFLTQGSNPRLWLDRRIFFFFLTTEPPGKSNSVLTLCVFLFFQNEGKNPKPTVMWRFHERKELLTPSRWGLGGTGSALELGSVSREQRESEWHASGDILVMMCICQELNKCKMSPCGFLVQKSGNKGTSPATQ